MSINDKVTRRKPPENQHKDLAGFLSAPGETPEIGGEVRTQKNFLMSAKLNLKLQQEALERSIIEKKRVTQADIIERALFEYLHKRRLN